MKTIRTVRQVIEREEAIDRQPQFGFGDYVEVYYGRYEGHNFWIKDIRYNHDRNCYEYLYRIGFAGDWLGENQIVIVERRTEAA